MTETLSERLWTRMTPSEKEAVREAAEEANMSMAAFARYCIRRTLLKMGKLEKNQPGS